MLKHIERRLYGDAVAAAIAILKTADKLLKEYDGDFSEGLGSFCAMLWPDLPPALKGEDSKVKEAEFRHISETALLLVYRLKQWLEK